MDLNSQVGVTDVGDYGVHQQGEDEVFDIFDQYMSSQPAVSSMFVHTELDMYLEEPTLPRTPDFDIINW